MTYLKMFGSSALLFSLCFAGAAVKTARAQNDGVDGPPNVLVVDREFTKPGRGGMAHERTEEAFKAAAKAGNAPFHYLAMTSMSGPDRALFFSGYASFKDWEDENKKMDKMPATAAALDHAMMADGDLLSSTDTSVWHLDREKSMNVHGLTGDRYMEILTFKIKPGHDAEWGQIVSMVKDGYEKSIPEASWAMFEEVYGADGNVYAAMIPLKSLAEKDAHMMDDPKFAAAMGKDGMKKMDALESDAVEVEETNLFSFSPKMSRPMQAWVDADPGYWNPKTEAPMKKKTEEKK